MHTRVSLAALFSFKTVVLMATYIEVGWLVWLSKYRVWDLNCFFICWTCFIMMFHYFSTDIQLGVLGSRWRSSCEEYELQNAEEFESNTCEVISYLHNIFCSYCFNFKTNALAPPPIALESCSTTRTDRPV